MDKDYVRSLNINQLEHLLRSMGVEPTIRAKKGFKTGGNLALSGRMSVSDTSTMDMYREEHIEFFTDLYRVFSGKKITILKDMSTCYEKIESTVRLSKDEICEVELLMREWLKQYIVGYSQDLLKFEIEGVNKEMKKIKDNIIILTDELNTLKERRKFLLKEAQQEPVSE